MLDFLCSGADGDFMNKGELVDAIADKAGVAKKQADAVLTAAIEAIIETVAGGEKVTLVGFGSWEPRDRAVALSIWVYSTPDVGRSRIIPTTNIADMRLDFNRLASAYGIQYFRSCVCASSPNTLSIAKNRQTSILHQSTSHLEQS